MKKTMCERGRKLASGGKGKLAKYSALVGDPRFVCVKCGRVAADEELLCKPAALGRGRSGKKK